MRSYKEQVVGRQKRRGGTISRVGLLGILFFFLSLGLSLPAHPPDPEIKKTPPEKNRSLDHPVQPSSLAKPGFDLSPFVPFLLPLPLGLWILYLVIVNRRQRKEVLQGQSIEKALKESEERYRTVFEQSNDGIAITRGNKHLYVNSKLADIFGYDNPEEIMNNPVTQLVHPNDRKMVTDRYQRRQRGEDVPSKYPFQGLKKNGDLVFIEISVSLIQYQGDPATLVFFRDITERKKAEEELHQSEQRYQEVVNSVSDMIYTQDLEGRFLSINTAGLTIFGYEKEELLGHQAADFMKLQFREAFETDYLHRLKTEGSYSGISLYFNKDGSRRYLEYRSHRVTSGDGSSFISGIARDVTDRILQERKLKKLQDQLSQSQRLEALGTLAGGVAHDFNNLLMGIQGRTSLMLMDCDTNNPHYEHLKGLEEYVKSAADLTKQLLGFARGGKYEVKPIDINELVKKTAGMFVRTQKEISLCPKYQEGVWTVEVDPGQIEQVLMNLYVNAWQAMPGGGALYLETRNVVLDETQVKPFSLRSGAYVQISVKDTGTGMDTKTKQRIFEPFFTTKEMGRGTGLGLASVYGIIKNHGGLIQVFSRPGEGTAFVICLPISEKKAVKEGTPVLEVLQGSETVLLVDDEAMILQVGRKILEKMGYQVLIAESGREALGLYEKEKSNIHLVILDMIMPHMGGGEVFDQLRQMNPKVKVLLSSGYSIDGQAEKILKRGCSGFIQKPFSITRLSQKIREILDYKG